MFKKLFLLNRRQKLALLLIFASLLLVPLTLSAIKKRTELRGRAEEGDDPRVLMSATVYIPYFPVGKAEKVVENELDTNWRNTLEIFNLSGNENQAEIVFFNQAGEGEATISAALAPHASQTIKLPVSPQCSGEGCLYSAIVKSSLGVSVVANLVREAANQYSVTSYKGIHREELNHVTQFPAIIRETGFNQDDKVETELVLFNPYDGDINFDVDIFNSEESWYVPAASISGVLQSRTSKRINTKSLSLPFPFKGSAVINSQRPIGPVVLLQSDKRLYSYTSAPYGTPLFLPAVHNQPLYYPFEFKDRIVVQSHAPGRQQVTLRFYQSEQPPFGITPTFETTLEIDPNLSSFFELDQFVDKKEGAIVLSAEHPISALMIKETPTYWGDVITAKSSSQEQLYFPFIANTGSDVWTQTQISMFNPYPDINHTFASFNETGQSIRKRTDDEPMMLRAMENKTVMTNHYLYSPDDRSFNKGVLVVYSGAGLKGAGPMAVVEGVRIINGSLALLAGDAFFSYEGQRLFGEPLPTPSPAIIIPNQIGCIQSPAYTEDLCNGYRLITSLESSTVCYETMDQCLPNQGEGTCIKSPTSEGDSCDGYRVMPGISRACYNFEECQALLTPMPTGEPQKCQLNGDYNGDGVVNMVDFRNWTKDFSKGEAKLSCFEYWRRNMYPGPTGVPIPIALSGFFALNPSGGDHPKGESFEVELKIDTGGQKSRSDITADAMILFDENILEVINVAPEHVFKNELPGKLYIGGGLLAGETSGVMAKITFNGKNEGTTVARFDCIPGKSDDSNITLITDDGGVMDILDCSKIVNGTYTVSDVPVTSTPCPNESCDINEDGQEDAEDYNLIVSSWRQPLDYCPRCDMNCDGVLNVVDIQRFVALCWQVIPTVTPMP